MTSFETNGPNKKTELEKNNPKEDKGEKERKRIMEKAKLKAENINENGTIVNICALNALVKIKIVTQSEK